MVVKPLFSVFKGAEECLHPIPRQLPALTPLHGIWGVLRGTAETHRGCTALMDSCQLSPRCRQEGRFSAFSIHSPHHLLVPAPASTRLANSAN